MQDFRKLNIYLKALEYCTKIYKFSAQLPSDEKYGMISQIRRASISIPLNISEGAGCNSNKEFSLFVSYAYRSCNEVLTCLELVHRLSLYRDRAEIDRLCTEGVEISRMIFAFHKKLIT